MKIDGPNEYPWWASFYEMIQFEAQNPDNWYCDIPQLDQEAVSALVDKCTFTQLLPAMRLMTQVIEENQLSAEAAQEAFHYVMEIICNLRSCFGAITLSSALSTEDLIVIAGLFDENDDAYIHSLGNLAGRVTHDAQAWEFLKAEANRISDPMVKKWLIPILKNQRTEQDRNSSGVDEWGS